MRICDVCCIVAVCCVVSHCVVCCFVGVCIVVGYVLLCVLVVCCWLCFVGCVLNTTKLTCPLTVSGVGVPHELPTETVSGQC